MSSDVYFLPGTMCDDRLWSDLVVLLDEKINPKFLSIPNHKNFSQIIEKLTLEMGDEPINLVGFSLGGYIASYIATRYPERIARLMVISNSPGTLSEKERLQRKSTLKMLKKLGYQGISQAKIDTLLSPDNRSERLSNVIREMDNVLGAETLISQLNHTSERIDLYEYFVNSPFHTLFLASEDDSLVDVHRLTELARNGKKIHTVITPGSGHMLPLEKPDEIARLIHNWLL